MNLNGEETFDQDPATTWAALHDVGLLAAGIPGCKSMKLVGANTYLVSVSLGVAAVRGEYEGKVKVTDVKAPSHFTIEGEGAGAPGFVKLKMDCRLAPKGSGTLMTWTCEAVVGGLIASIGGRVLSGISKFMAKQFFKAFKDEMKTTVAKAA